MKMIFMRVFVSLSAALFAPALFWVGGFDFVRGDAAFFCLLLTVFIFAMSVACPYWGKQ